MYDLEDFGYNSVNITSFRLIDHTPENTRIIEDMQRFNAKSYSKVLQVIWKKRFYLEESMYSVM